MSDARLSDFQRHRGYLTGLAYRILGSIADAEDAVQDAWLRWSRVGPGDVDDARAYLSTVVTRLCLDRLRDRRRRRERYVGVWLPEPLIEAAAGTTDPVEMIDRDVSVALMLALERLSPLERAAFILHDLFDLGFDEIAATLRRSQAACRQLASRARARVRSATPRFEVSDEAGDRVAEAFFDATRSGDTARLRALLANTAILHTDGGGQRRAALNPIFGADRICRLLDGLRRKEGMGAPVWWRRVRINGLSGWVTVEADGTLQTTAVAVESGRIVAIYVVRNPEKLLHAARLVPAGLVAD